MDATVERMARALFAGKTRRAIRASIEWVERLPDGLGRDLAREGERYLAREQRSSKELNRARPGGLRSRRKLRGERTQAGYCRHGVYVGGCGPDWMCGRCEQGEEWDTSSLSKSERVNLERWYERQTPNEQAFWPDVARELGREG